MLGLAPAQLLAGVKFQDSVSTYSNDELDEAVRSHTELMSVEDDKKEWNDGFVSVDKKMMADADTEPDDDADAAEAGAATGNSSSSEEEGDSDSDSAGEKKGASKAIAMMHGAFLSAGIKLRPREVMPLLLALGIRPRRLTRIGRLDFFELKKAFIESGKDGRHRFCFNGRDGGGGMGHPDMGNARAGGDGPRGPGCMGGGPFGRRGNGFRGPGGQPCMPGCFSGGGSPISGMFFPPPPPTPPRGDDMRGGGGPGGFWGPHHHQGHYGGGGGGGAWGYPFSPEMMMWMDARAARYATASPDGGGGGGARGGGCNGRHWYVC